MRVNIFVTEEFSDRITEVCDRLTELGLHKGTVLGSLGVITGEASASAMERFRKVAGVECVEEEKSEESSC